MKKSKRSLLLVQPPNLWQLSFDFAQDDKSTIHARFVMKAAMVVACAVFALMPFEIAGAQTQTFPTSSGPVKITPLYHASTLIEAGGKVIYLDPAKPAKLAGLPKADLILITD